MHQISIGALIISLGMLVDDPVVAADAINRELAEGQSSELAAWLGPHKLRRPILFGTIINIFAFLPLLLVPGDDGAFIVALPIVVTLALAASRLVSMTFIPLLGYYFLRPQPGLEAGGEVRHFFLFAWVDRALLALLPRYRAALHWGLARPLTAIALAYGLLALSLGAAPLIGTEFFPPAEGNRLLIDVELPQSASLTQTRAACEEVVRHLQTTQPSKTRRFSSAAAARAFITTSSPSRRGRTWPRSSSTPAAMRTWSRCWSSCAANWARPSRAPAAWSGN